MIHYRLARQDESDKVAFLHARSWQDSYRNILTKQYLDHNVVSDRMEVWHKRFDTAFEKHYCILAEAENELIGFACTLLEEDATWGALLDNLHVLGTRQGKGIGAHLLLASAKWVLEQAPHSHFYLWVYVENKKAIRFYERMGGTRKEQISVNNPGGGSADIYRYVWTDLKTLVKDFDYITL